MAIENFDTLENELKNLNNLNSDIKNELSSITEEELLEEETGDQTQNEEMLIDSQPKSSKDKKDIEFSLDTLKQKIEKSYYQISIMRKMKKFYNRRYQLFNKFDSGILLDRESWYSVTPEAVARHIAQKCFKKLGCISSLTVLDAFCGSGGNTIQFAEVFDSVISCDIDFVKLQCAQNNAKIYGVDHKIRFLMQDFFNLDRTINLKQKNIDLVFLSPPWGGVNYFHAREADISEFPLDCFRIFNYCANILKCKNIVLFMPRNVNLEQILYLAGPSGYVEIEQNFLDHKLVAISAYYGDLFDFESFEP
jgi:tRNA/tmRNA/rRNA uracil-C5-methylase (TrmA/RlmC/RlmD family)